MSDFGDFDPDDALDTEPADPEQVAKKLHALRQDNGLETIDWDALSAPRKAAAILAITLLLAWLRRQGSLR